MFIRSGRAIQVLIDRGFNPARLAGYSDCASRELSRPCFVQLYRTHHFLRIRRDELALFTVDWSLVRLLVTKGIPMGRNMRLGIAEAVAVPTA
jgi:hypothetical protein